ncbi:WD40-repeat-containing domain protein [Polychytrium aggregatum]|uniref:WD40-repeat-containing domain protein n=1 Tax=Polychytrium aggregatum TaxID=110093 RepID=UPI0022FE9589|nr:WD40-repeat-containing domain protein [Polychytrium aggregatum]KAI9208595.1 WD40-repeat-containing domain protein [Polychytrium aggregatum]
MHTFAKLMELRALGGHQHRAETQATHRALFESGSNAALAQALFRQNGSTFSYHRELKGHFGCVNAIALSKRESALLASGGDDTRVLIWKVYEESGTQKPIACFSGHTENIFCLQFDSTNQKLYSCAADGMIIQYMVERGIASYPRTRLPSNISSAHDDMMSKISIMPTDDNILLSSGHDHCINLWDMRCPDPFQAAIVGQSAQNSVEFNPVHDTMFLSSDSSGNILLRDLRCFRTRPSVQASTPTSASGVLMKYSTDIEKHGERARPLDIPSATWSPDGSHIGTVFQKFYPTLYHISRSEPICIFKSRNKEKHNGFRSAQTIKTGAFGNLLGSHFACGSEDFRIYGWEVPRSAGGDVVLPDTGTSSTNTSQDIAFVVDGQRVHPPQIQETFVLEGPRSIVNSVLFHPYMPYVYSAGVEKVVRQHSIFRFPHQRDAQDTRNMCPDRLPPTVRERRWALLGLVVPAYDPPDSYSTEEDISTLRFFDALVDTDRTDGDWGEELSFHGSDSSDTSDASSSNVDSELEPSESDEIDTSLSSDSWTTIDDLDNSAEADAETEIVADALGVEVPAGEVESTAEAIRGSSNAATASSRSGAGTSPAKATLETETTNLADRDEAGSSAHKRPPESPFEQPRQKKRHESPSRDRDPDSS